MSSSRPPALEPWDDESNRRLAAAVRPPDWRSPEPAPRYNLVVIGAGTAGLVAAAGAAGLGARVALVERELMGGDCLNVGCVPSKAVLAAARAAATRNEDLGIERREKRVDFAAVMRRMRSLRAEIAPNDSAERFRNLGVDVFFGAARFAEDGVVDVDGRRLPYSRAVIATGARAAAPPIPGLAETGYLTNETVFSLESLPRRLAVIGGGPIGCELAQAFARFGAEVHLLESAERILLRDDPEAAAIVARVLEGDGVRIACGARIARVEATAAGARRLALDEDSSLEVDAIVVAAGRRPNLEGLDLDRVGIASDPARGVVVDDFLRTTNPRVYACGDVCTPLRFTHHSDAQARIVVQNALFFGRARASRLRVPWCTYTDPELAQVGLTEMEARERGVAMRTFTQPFAEVDRALLDGDREGFVRIHVGARRDRILGATIVGRGAGDLVSEISVAMAGDVGLGALARVIHPYPTRAEAIRKLGDQYNRTRLTPTLKKLFERLLAWRRS